VPPHHLKRRLQLLELCHLLLLLAVALVRRAASAARPPRSASPPHVLPELQLRAAARLGALLEPHALLLLLQPSHVSSHAPTPLPCSLRRHMCCSAASSSLRRCASRRIVAAASCRCTLKVIELPLEEELHEPRRPCTSSAGCGSQTTRAAATLPPALCASTPPVPCAPAWLEPSAPHCTLLEPTMGDGVEEAALGKKTSGPCVQPCCTAAQLPEQPRARMYDLRLPQSRSSTRARLEPRRACFARAMSVHTARRAQQELPPPSTPELRRARAASLPPARRDPTLLRLDLDPRLAAAATSRRLTYTHTRPALELHARTTPPPPEPLVNASLFLPSPSPPEPSSAASACARRPHLCAPRLRCRASIWRRPHPCASRLNLTPPRTIPPLPCSIRARPRRIHVGTHRRSD
jgi:hypothetical protein